MSHNKWVDCVSMDILSQARFGHAHGNFDSLAALR